MTRLYRMRLIISTSLTRSSLTNQFFKENYYVLGSIFILNRGGITIGRMLSYYLYYEPFFASSLLKLTPSILLASGMLLAYFL